MIFNKLSDDKQDFLKVLSHFGLLIFIHFLLYVTLRLFFFVWNYSQLKSLSLFQIIYAFLLGLRFDLAILGPLSALIVLSVFWLPKYLSHLTVTLILLFQVLLIAANIADSELINYMGRRFSVNSLYIINEGGSAGLLIYYPLIIFGLLLITGYLYFCVKNLDFNTKGLGSKHKISTLTKIIITFLLITFSVITGRGGFQDKPISFINAKVINHPLAHQLVLNSSFTFIKSIGRSPAERLHFFDDQKMLSFLNLEQNLNVPSPQKINNIKSNSENPNIIIFLVESLSTEYLSQKNTPFLAELSKKGTLFNGFANGRRSVEGVAAVMSGVPALMEESFINSEFATNDFIGLGTLLKNKNYQTSFFHGGHNGTMRFDSFTNAAGFDQYYGKNEFNLHFENGVDVSKFDDQAWGIYDEPFLKWSCDSLSDQYSKNKKPIASVVFTLSSHVPYNLPPEFKTKIANSDIKNETGIIPSIRYVDFSLENFFKCAENQIWFSNTLFIIMADHTGSSLRTDADFKSKFEIPNLFYSKNSDLLNGLSQNKYAQQIDIIPTLTDLLNIPLPAKNHLARSLYQPGQKTIALFSDQKYELVGDSEKSEDHLKAIRQYFSQGLYDNRLYFPSGQIR